MHRNIVRFMAKYVHKIINYACFVKCVGFYFSIPHKCLIIFLHAKTGCQMIAFIHPFWTTLYHRLTPPFSHPRLYFNGGLTHYTDVIMGAIVSQITQPHECLFNRLLRRRSKKASKLRVTGLCAGNSPGTGEFPAQMASNAENVSI